MTDAPGTDPDGSTGAASGKGLVARLLSPIADVRDDEVSSVLLMTLTMFLILAGYYLLKTAREQFILSEGGAAVKSYSSAGQALLLVILVPAYGAFASRVNQRAADSVWVTLFFVADLGLFDARALGRTARRDRPIFIWVGIFNVFRRSRSSGRLPTTSTPRNKANACFQSSMIGMTAWAPG